mgnify:CR=1 FL=1
MKTENKIFNINAGKVPYVFISYSHRDTESMTEICNVFLEHRVRFWYDDGLHSGDDWNFVIASKLEKASICLVLMSKEAAKSSYVKNELNFAQNHRIPVHVIGLEEFQLPIDLEMMLGRIQMMEKKPGYEQKLLESLPGEVFEIDSEILDLYPAGMEHPLFQVENEIANRQGTISYVGKHKMLGYEIIVQVEEHRNVTSETLWKQVMLVANLLHPLFPKLYDVVMKNGKMYTYQESQRGMFLDQYLQEHQLYEAEITEWISLVIDAMDVLFKQNLGLRDLAKGSLIVTRDKKLCLNRLQNPYYGVIKLKIENKQYYFEKEVEEIGVLLYQLCTGRIPILPFDLIHRDGLSQNFINKVNLIIQKCTKEDYKIGYQNFQEITADLQRQRISVREWVFLKKRREKLKEYEAVKKKNLQRTFTEESVPMPDGSENLEEQFGFDSTVVLQDIRRDKASCIKVRICSTGQVLEFSKDCIEIGRGQNCDMILKQPMLSRNHVRIYRKSDDEYAVEDLYAANGTFIESTNTKIAPGATVNVQKGESIRLGDIRLQLN